MLPGWQQEGRADGAVGGICRDGSSAQRNGLGQEHPEPRAAPSLRALQQSPLLAGDLFLLEKGFKKHLTETIT